MKGIFRSINENNKRRLDKILGRKGALKLEPQDLNDSLFEAIRQGKSECVASLIQAGADPNADDEEGKSPMIVLMEKNGNPATLRELLKAGASPNKVTWNHQQTALHVAARKGYQVAVKLLIGEGAKINKADCNGHTALMLSSREGHVTTVRHLLQEGANPNSVNHRQEAAMHLASRAGHGECVLELLEENGHPNLLDNRGRTPLYLAFEGGHLDVQELLLEYHCDVNCQDSHSGKSPLHWAIGQSNPKLVYTLLRMGAEPNIRDAEWQTPFLLALQMGSTDMVSLLMKAGCDVNVTDRNFNQALHIAAKDGCSNLVPLLLGAELDCNLKGAGGLTPLMLAAYGGHVTVVKDLLGFSARVSLVDRNKASALTFAIISDAEEAKINAIVKLLIRHHASLDESCNLQNLVDIYNVGLSPNVVVENRLYCPAELAYLRGRVPALMMLIAAGCDLHRFKCNELQPMYDCKNHKSDFKNSLYLLKVVKKERFRLKSLKELCRRPALEACGDKIPGGRIGKMPVSDLVKRYLHYDDLEVIEMSYTMTLKDRRSLGSISEGPFSRNDRRRQTIQAGERRARPTSMVGNDYLIASRTRPRGSRPPSPTESLDPDSAFRRSLRGSGSSRSQTQSLKSVQGPSSTRKTLSTSTSSNSRPSVSPEVTTRVSSARQISPLTRSATASAPSKPRPRSSLECSMSSTERASSALVKSTSVATHAGTQRQYSSLSRSASTANDRSNKTNVSKMSQTGHKAGHTPVTPSRYMLPSSRCTSTSPRSASSSRSTSPTPGWMLSHSDYRPPSRQGNRVEEIPRPPFRLGNRTAEVPRPASRQGNRISEDPRPPSRQGNRIAEIPRPASRQGNRIFEDPRPPSRQGNRIAEIPRPPSRQGNRTAEAPRPPSRQGNHIAEVSRPLSRQGTHTTEAPRPLSRQGNPIADVPRPSSRQGSRRQELPRTPSRHSNPKTEGSEISRPPSRQGHPRKDHLEDSRTQALDGGLTRWRNCREGYDVRQEAGSLQPLSPLPMEDSHSPAFNGHTDGPDDVTTCQADEGYPVSPTDSVIDADPLGKPVVDIGEGERRPASRIPVPTFQRISSFRSTKSDMTDEEGKSYFVRSRSVRKW